MKKKILKRVKITTYNIVMLVQLILSGIVFFHDFYLWGIKPLFTGNFILVTYFGLMIDFVAVGLMVCSIEHFKELFK